MLCKTPENPMGKIGENCQYRNIFDVSIEKPRWGINQETYIIMC
jgi:hypothetical protein